MAVRFEEKRKKKRKEGCRKWKTVGSGEVGGCDRGGVTERQRRRGKKTAG